MANISSTYKGHGLLRGQHLETLYPALARKVTPPDYTKHTITTPDEDFLEYDLYDADSNSLIIISHGLEGNSERAYMQGMARHFHLHGYDVICWNYRGCGSKINKQPRLYHSGATEDLDTLISSIQDNRTYTSISLIGFSLGGNITLKYLGEKGTDLHEHIKSAAVFSVPLDLSAGSDRLSESDNFLYEWRFLRKLKAKTRLKLAQYPELISVKQLDQIKTLREFDDKITGPIHGFEDAADYYAKCSSINFISQISIPTLIVNAKNDPFLPEACYPHELMDNLDCISFETPARGGHVGFYSANHDGTYWSEQRALDFIESQINNSVV